MELLVAILCFLFVLWFRWRWQRTSIFQRLGVAGPKPNLIFGNILELYKKGPLKCHEEWVKKYGRVLGYYYGMKPVLLITDPQLLKNIFIRDFPKFINREAFNPLMEYDPNDEAHQSVLNMPGQPWKDVRSVLTPTFTTAKMKQMAGSMNSSIDDMLAQLQVSAESGQEVNIHDVYQRLTMDVITRTAFGIRTDVQTNRNSKILQATKLLFATSYYDFLIFVGLSFPLLRWFCTKLHSVALLILNKGVRPHVMLKQGIRDVLQFRRQNKQSKKTDLLQLMIDSSITVGTADSDISKLEAGNVEIERKLDSTEVASKKTRGMSDAEIISSAFTVLLAGYETTSTALAFTTYLLAKHPESQKRLFEEISQLIRSGQKLEYATVNKLPFLDQVLNEGMRLYPPVNLFTNRYAVEDVQYGDLRIPRGTIVQAPVYLMHHDPEFWTEPESFDPERFSSKPNSDGITFLPFGVGPRNCLGMRFAQLEAKLALANTVYRFHITLGNIHKNDFKVSTLIRMITPREGVHVRLQERATE